MDAESKQADHFDIFVQVFNTWLMVKQSYTNKNQSKTFFYKWMLKKKGNYFNQLQGLRDTLRQCERDEMHFRSKIISFFLFALIYPNCQRRERLSSAAHTLIHLKNYQFGCL